MGVDFISCARCGHNFPDCGRFAQCNDEFGGCGNMYCSAACGEVRKSEFEEEDDYDGLLALSDKEQEEHRSSCIDCRGEHASAANVLAFILKSIGMTRDEADAKYLADAKKP